jgi:hypothetical protein
MSEAEMGRVLDVGKVKELAEVDPYLPAKS